MAPAVGRGTQMQAAAAGRGGGAQPGGRGRGRGTGGKGDAEVEPSGDRAKELEQLEDSSVALESSLEILRAERAAKRSGRGKQHDTVREDEGVDEDDPLINVDDGIRLEPFNMRREMEEGHFDDSGFYVLNKDEEKEVTDAWLDTVDQASKSATFAQEAGHEKAAKIANEQISALKRNLGKDEVYEDDEDEKGGSWIVEIDKSSGEGRLGIGIKVKEDEENGDIIEVDDIDESGLIAAWNQANRTKAVQSGDRLVELNGDSSTAGITCGLGKKEVLKLKFSREERPEPEEKDAASMIEELVAELLPLETPVEALARFRKGGAPSRGPAAKAALEPLRMRARIKQASKAAAEQASKAAAGAQGSAAGATAAQRPTRRKLNEWGDYEAGSGGGVAGLGDAVFLAVDASADDGASNTPAVATTAAGSGGSTATGEGQAAGSEAVGGSSSSSTVLVDKEAAVTAAAEKVAAQDKAIAEAAKAAAAEAKLARCTLYMDVDPSKGPEALALEAAQKRKAGGEPEEDRPTAASLAASSKKRKGEPGILEQARRRKIERLTDICDYLLERGVLAYNSTREQLAIEVRERRGEFEQKDKEKDNTADDAAAGNKDQATAAEAEKKPAEGAAAKAPKAAPAPTLVYENKRFTPAASQAGDSTGSGLLGLLGDGGAAEAAIDPDAPAVSTGRPLLWQFRWAATPEQLNGPFDSVTMHGWMTQACFSEERPAEVRQCDDANQATEQCWHPMMEVNFGLYM